MDTMNKQYARHCRDKWYSPEWAWWRELPNDARALFDFLCDCHQAAGTLTGIFRPPLVDAAVKVVEQQPGWTEVELDRYVKRLLRALEQAGAIEREGEYIWVIELTRLEGVQGSALAAALAEVEDLKQRCPVLASTWTARYCPGGRAAIAAGGRPRKADKPPVIEAGGNGKPGVIQCAAEAETGGFEHDNNAQFREAVSSSLRSELTAARSAAEPATAAASLLGDNTAPPGELSPQLVELAAAMIGGLGGPRMTLPPKRGPNPLAKGMATAATSMKAANAASFKAAWLWGQGQVRSPWPTRMLEGVKWLKGALFVTLLSEWEAAGAPGLPQVNNQQQAAPQIHRPPVVSDLQRTAP